MEMFNSENRYVSMANKYRPQAFEDMVGQETISKTLTNAIKLGRIGHAYLFYGPRGCGKTTTARIFAKALNCTGNGDAPTPTPCGKCPQCLEIAAGSDMDVLELDAASNTQVEKIREAIIDTVSLASSRDRFKVFILDEVHMLSDSSFNALLKTVEEPPSHVVFIMATTEKHKVPATISSRCQTFRFKPIVQEDIAAHLTSLAQKEKIDIEPAAVSIIAAQAGGAMRDALTTMDRAISFSDGTITEALVTDMLGLMPQDLLKNALEALFTKDSANLHKVFETIGAEGFDPLSFLRDLKNALGALFYLSIGHGSEPFAKAKDLAKSVSPSFIAALTRKINRVIDETKFADNPLISAEVGLFTVMDSCIDLDAFIKRLETIENALNTGGFEPVQKKNLTAEPAQTPATAAATAPQIAPAEQNVTITPKAVTASIRIEAEPAPQSAPKPKVAHAKIADTPVTKPKKLSILNKEPANEDWQKLKTSFKDNFFIFDALNNCTPAINGADWTLTFNSANSFYETALKVKIAELEEKTQEVLGKKINFTFNSEAPAPAETKAEPAPQTKTFKSKFTAPAKTEPAAQPYQRPAISTEEPFVPGSYAAFAEDEPAKLDRDVPASVLDILKIVPGEVIG